VTGQNVWPTQEKQQLFQTSGGDWETAIDCDFGQGVKLNRFLPNCGIFYQGVIVSERRKFSKRERQILFYGAFGRCAMCGQPLGRDFHADHRIPYSKGGKTSLDNGAALCPQCNMSKGDKLMPKFPSVDFPKWFTPRKWQGEFFNVYHQRCLEGNKRNFLLEACPGAGKTNAIFAIAKKLIKAYLIDWIVIGVPGDHLRTQVCEEALDWNLDLFGGTGEFCPIDYQGEIVTYAQISAVTGDILKNRCNLKKGRVLVVADEVHHLAELKNWGQRFMWVFSEAKYRLFTTGTPFRSDQNKILGSWIDYELKEDDSQECVPDYRYGYDRAVLDRIVRRVVFPNYDGDFQWWLNDELYKSSFAEAISKKEESRCLVSALLPNGDWLKETLREANEKLNEVRQFTGQENAAGLIVCKAEKGEDGVKYAQQVARTLKEVTGETAVIVTYEDKESSEKIKRFAKGNKLAPKWLVAIRKVSEGVTIKRLRVCVYATNILTRMFFYQVMGRILRVIENGNFKDETAYMYIPAHSLLVKYAMEVNECVSHLIKDEDGGQDGDWDWEDGEEGLDGDGGGDFFEFFLPQSSTSELDSHILNGEKIGKDEIYEAREYQKREGLLEYPEAVIAKVRRDAKQEERSHHPLKETTPEYVSVPQGAKPVQPPKKPKHVQSKELKKVLKQKVFELAKLENKVQNLDGTIKTRRNMTDVELDLVTSTVQEIYKKLQRLTGEYNNQASLEDLQKKLEWVEEQIKKFRKQN